jgi:uncharacterized protein
VNVLAEAIKRGVTNPPGQSRLHGEEHWKCVAMAGLQIGRSVFTPGFDPEFLLTFAQLHDIMRLDDDEDPEHGPRAGALFVALCDSPGIPGFEPYSERAMTMHTALTLHTTQRQWLPNDELDLNIGICWDADRCNLWRVGIVPDRRYFSTDAGWETIFYGRELVSKQLGGGSPFPSWDQIVKEIGDWRWP